MDPLKVNITKKQALSVAMLLLVYVAAACIFWQRRPFHTSMGIELTVVLLLTLLPALLRQVPLSRFSYLLLGPLLAIEALSLYSYVAHMATLTLFLLFDLGLLLFLQSGRLRPYFASLSAAGLTAGFFLLGYNVFSHWLTPIYYTLGRRFHLDPVQKSLLLAGTGLVFLLLYVLCLKLLARVFRRWLEHFSLLSRRFYELGPFVLILVILTILFWHVLEYRLFLTDVYDHLPYFVAVIPFFFFFMNLAYLLLLLKTLSLREKMQLAEEDKSLLSAYNSELENTLDSLHEIRHDSKNLLLTMAGFVEQSNNAAMKEFYQKNIVPFMHDALIRNELQSKLKLLRDDCLKSFLYYKILEKTNQGVPVRFSLASPMCLQIGCGDMIRLLGIFIDNAAEEALQIKGGISLDIDETEKELRIRIANDVRPDVRSRGIVPGTTDKGLGRGQGLLIAGKILRRYPNLFLNSYFTEEGFVQCLVLLKDR